MPENNKTELHVSSNTACRAYDMNLINDSNSWPGQITLPLLYHPLILTDGNVLLKKTSLCMWKSFPPIGRGCCLLQFYIASVLPAIWTCFGLLSGAYKRELIIGWCCYDARGNCRRCALASVLHACTLYGCQPVTLYEQNYEFLDSTLSAGISRLFGKVLRLVTFSSCSWFSWSFSCCCVSSISRKLLLKKEPGGPWSRRSAIICSTLNVYLFRERLHIPVIWCKGRLRSRSRSS